VHGAPAAASAVIGTLAARHLLYRKEAQMSHSHRWALRVFGVLALLAVAGLLPSSALAVSIDIQPNYTNVTNNDGTWRIYTHCADGVGPGYVAKVTMANGNVLLDDTNTGTQDNPAGGATSIRINLGLGKLIFRDARATQGTALTFTDNNLAAGGNTYVMDQRHCAGVSAGGGYTNPVGTDPGVNDSLSGPVDGTPSYDSFTDTAMVDVGTIFQDPQSSDVLRVTQKWRFYPNYVKLWTEVWEDCNATSCPNAWIKGPKFVAGVNGHPDAASFTQLTTYNSTGTGVCAADYSSPAVNAGKCGSSTRARTQFNYVTNLTLPATVTAAPNCSASQRCFNAIFRGYDPGFGISPDGVADNWVGDSHSPDGWAVSAASRATEGTGVPSSCSTQTSTSAVDSRMWEAPGDKTDTNGDGTINYLDKYAYAAGYFFGWRDCVNVEDDQKTYVRYGGGPGVGHWGMYASFSLNNGTTSYFSQTMNG
jgi:hypothetical protein